MRKSNKKILITGGAGYIGQNLVSFFLKEKYPIYVIDNLSTSVSINNNIKKNIIKSKLPIKSLSKSNYKIIFSTNFGRDIEYYTGMVFEISASKNKQKIARGGRYDDLLKNLGSKKNIPAVGAAIYLDNLSKITK